MKDLKKTDLKNTSTEDEQGDAIYRSWERTGQLLDRALKGDDEAALILLEED